VSKSFSFVLFYCVSCAKEAFLFPEFSFLTISSFLSVFFFSIDGFGPIPPLCPPPPLWGRVLPIPTLTVNFGPPLLHLAYVNGTPFFSSNLMNWFLLPSPPPHQQPSRHYVYACLDYPRASFASRLFSPHAQEARRPNAPPPCLSLYAFPSVQKRTKEKLDRQ